MSSVDVLIVAFVDDAQPGWVRCSLRDAWGCEWAFVDKVPIFTAAPLDRHSDFPRPGVLACEVLREWRDEQGRELRTIDTSRPFGIEATTGETRFDVLAEQITRSHAPPDRQAPDGGREPL